MFFVFDIGATKMRVAVSKDGKSLDKKSIKIVSTPQSFVEAMELFHKLSEELAFSYAKKGAPKQLKIVAAAGGVASSLDRKRGVVVRAPNLPEWNGKPLQKEVMRALGTKKVFLENDTALVGLGEAVAGAGKKKKIIMYITASTGVNGVRVVDGKIDKSAAGFEIGRQILGDRTEETLEYFVGAGSLTRRFGQPAQQIKDPHIWEEATKYLARGIYNTILEWSPEMVILGGGIILSGDISVERVGEELARLPKAFAKLPPLKKAVLGDLGGLYGALELLRQER